MRRPRALIVLGGLLCLLGGSFDTPTLLMAGCGLLLLTAAAVGWVTLSVRRCTVVRAVDRDLLEEGDTLDVSVRVRSGGVPLPGGVLVAWPGQHPVPLTRVRSDPLVQRVTLTRRGRHTVEPAIARIADPFAVCVAESRSQPTRVLVLPRVSAVRAEAGAGAGGHGRHAGGASPHAAALEVDSLRPHRPGAPASRIHWPTVARSGVLMEHRLISDTDRHPLIVVNARDPVSDDALDEALRAAASLVLHLGRAGGCSLLLPGEARTLSLTRDLHEWPALHARLALVQAGGAVPTASRLARAATFMWVTARPAPRAPRGGPLGQDGFLVSPFPLPGQAIAFRTGGCVGQRLGAGIRSRVA